MALQNSVPSESSFATKSALFGKKNVCPFQILDLTLYFSLIGKGTSKSPSPSTGRRGTKKAGRVPQTTAGITAATGGNTAAKGGNGEGEVRTREAEKDRITGGYLST